MVIAKLKEIIKNSREDGILARWHEKKERECENCPCSWESRSYEGECEDCGCRLYKDYDCRHKGCLLPDFVLKIIARRRQAELDELESKQYEGVGEWYMESEKRDRLFHRALHEKMFTDASGKPAPPLYRSRDGRYFPYAPSDAWAAARMDYEENLESGMPPIKAFQKAIAEYLTPELYYDAGGGRHETFRIFGNSAAAMERYHELLLENGIAIKGGR